VSYDEATAYCAAYGKRLPLEEEWEWAVRGGPKAMRYPWGKFDAHAEELCWSKVHKDRPFKRASTCIGGSHPLDTTPDGVQDMAGNVSEWVIGTSGGRKYPALRGASFWAVDDGYVKAAMWGFDSPAKRSEIFGVRCVRDARSSVKTQDGDVKR
jgi:formylglycine-generating enzyme required for sulfatase activity